MNQETSSSIAATFSLVITVYNGQAYLAATIESVLQQTRKDWQLLIWDDGSTDSSLEIAHRYAQQDQRIRVIAAQHQGRGVALANAVDQTTGIYLGFVDSDDLLAPTTLAETAEILDAQPKIGLVYTDYLVIDANGQVKGLGKRCQIPYSQERLLVDFMTFHFRLIRREVYNNVGGINSEFTSAQDYDLCLRLSEVTEVVHLSKPLYYYRNHAESISHTQQFEQIQFSSRAINEALQRRGLADELELLVQVNPRFMLKRKKLKTWH